MSIEEAKKIAYKKIYELTKLDENHENTPLIIDKYTLEFEWGILFYYNGKKAIEENNPNYDYFIALPVLVDKFSKESTEIYTKFKVLDTELEKYRETKGYKQVIKFPITEDMSGKSILNQVKSYFKSNEILQIKKGLQIAKENKLLDIPELEKIVYNNFLKKRTFEENILEVFQWSSINLNSAIDNCFPKELKLFRDFTDLSLSGVELGQISEDITQLEKLERIELWGSSIDKITFEIMSLENLKEISILMDCKIGNQAREIIGVLQKKNNVKVNEY